MNTDPNKTPDNKPDESLAQRSARLEAEAEAMAKKDFAADEDMMAPTQEPSFSEELDAAEGDMRSMQDELDQAKEQLMRALAETENTRRRSVKEREDAGKYAISKFSKDLLDVADNLRRALEAIPGDLKSVDPRIEGIVGGIEATERELLKSFDKNGIEKMEPLDQPFDPNFHEVMFEAPMPGKPAGTIMQVVEFGYTLNGRLLRPAKVGVTKAEDGGTPPPSQNGTPDGTPHIDTEV